MKVKPLSQQDWEQLLIIASGYLTLTGGNLDLAMARAIEAHARLIDSVKKGRITTRLGKGSVRLIVPEEGGLALAFDAPERAVTPPPVPTREAGARPAPSTTTGGPGVVVAAITPLPPPLEPTLPMVRPMPPAEDLPSYPDVSFEVFERTPSTHTTAGRVDDASTMDE
jgi:hypothetical protein